MEIQPRLEKARLQSIFQLWLEDYPLYQLPWKLSSDLIEIPFQVPLTDNIVYCGVMDQIGQMKNTGKWVVIDIKTTRKVSDRWLSKFQMDTQVTGYIYAAKQHLINVEGMLIGIIELPDPKVSTRKCPEHAVPYVECDLFHAKFHWVGPFTRSDEELENWKRVAIQTAQEYEKLMGFAKALADPLQGLYKVPMDGMFRQVEYANACMGCELKHYCKEGRPTFQASNTFKFEPWFCFQDMLSNMKNPLGLGMKY